MFNNLFLHVASTVNKPLKKPLPFTSTNTGRWRGRSPSPCRHCKSLPKIRRPSLTMWKSTPIRVGAWKRCRGLSTISNCRFAAFSPRGKHGPTAMKPVFPAPSRDHQSKRSSAFLRLKELVQASCKDFKRELDARTNALLAAMNAAMGKRSSLENFENVSKTDRRGNRRAKERGRPHHGGCWDNYRRKKDGRNLEDMINSSIRDNHKKGSVGDFLIENIKQNSSASIVSAYFTIYAYKKLQTQLTALKDSGFFLANPHLLRQLTPIK